MRGYGITFTAPLGTRTSTITGSSGVTSLTPTPGVVTLRRTISLPSEFPDVMSPSYTLESSGAAGSGGAGIDPTYRPPSWLEAAAPSGVVVPDSGLAYQFPAALPLGWRARPSATSPFFSTRSGAGRPGASESGRQPRWWRGEVSVGGRPPIAPRGGTRPGPRPSAYFSPGAAPGRGSDLLPEYTWPPGAARSFPAPTRAPFTPSGASLVPPSGYLPPSFTPPEGSTRSFPTPGRSPFTPSGSSTVPTFDPSRRSTTPSFPTPLVSGSLPSYPTPGGRGGPRRSFWDLFRPAPPRPFYPQYPQQQPYYTPLVPGGELYASGVFGPGMDAVAEMPTTTAPVVEAAPAATTSPWLLLAGLAAAGFVAYRFLGKRRAAPGAA